MLTAIGIAVGRMMNSNVECRRNVFYLFYKKTERSDSILRHSLFDILRFCGSFSNLVKFHAVSGVSNPLIEELPIAEFKYYSSLEIRSSDIQNFSIPEIRSNILNTLTSLTRRHLKPETLRFDAWYLGFSYCLKPSHPSVKVFALMLP